MSQLAGIFILGILSGWLLEWIFIRLLAPNSDKTLETALQASRREVSRLQQQNRELQAALTAAKAASNTPMTEMVKAQPSEILEKLPTESAHTSSITEVAIDVDKATPSDDDLTRLTGIGPKLSAAMKAAGICTYAQLMTMNTEDIRQALANSNIRYNKTVAESWAEQARLATAGDWNALKAYQTTLKG